MSPSTLFGQPRVVDDLVVTLTPIPDPSEILGRGARRRAFGHLQDLMTRGTRSGDVATPPRIDMPALTVPGGSIRATLSLDDGPAGRHSDGSDVAGDQHWHLAMSLSHDGRRGPAPTNELAAWIAVGWSDLNAVDTYVMTMMITARHAHLPVERLRQR